MAPIAFAAAWYREWSFLLLVSIAGIALAWEWSRLCFRSFTMGGLALALTASLAPLISWRFSDLLLPFLVIALPMIVLTPVPAGRSRWWMALGSIYIILPQLALIEIRQQGRWLLLWVLFLVWATDSGAYFAGRLIGGPKLAPRISPKKTWAGLAGGMLAAALVGWAIRHGQAQGALHLAMLSALLAVVAQAGDLAESGLKRYFGVKDSSQLIPGHGGVFDRLDGLLAVAPVAAALTLFWPGGWDVINGW